MPQKPVLIAQISDLHIKPPGTLAYGRVDTARALERCVATLNAVHPEARSRGDLGRSCRYADG